MTNALAYYWTKKKKFDEIGCLEEGALLVAVESQVLPVEFEASVVLKSCVFVT
jgi:hypothetical protein